MKDTAMSSTLPHSKLTELKPRITVIGVGGAGGNAINNMIASGIDGVDFIAANTDSQALVSSSAEKRIQLGIALTEGLGAGAKPEIGEAAAAEAIDDIRAAIDGSHMVFIAAGMGGGTGTGATSVIAKASRVLGILTVAIVTKPFNFEGNRRMRTADQGIEELRQHVDTLIVIPNQNLFRIANERTTFAEAFLLADQVLHSGIACITDLIVREGLINLDFADVRAVMAGMGTAMMGTGEASGEHRALEAAELAILNPLLDDVSLSGARGLLVSISGSRSLTLYEVDEAASRVRQEVDPEANVIIGATFDESLSDKIRVSIVASGLQNSAAVMPAKEKPAPAAKPSFQARAEPTPQLGSWHHPVAAEAPRQPELQSAGQHSDHPGFSESDAAQWYQDPQPQPYDQALQHPDPEPARTWQGPGDVVIELGPPQGGLDQQPWYGRGPEASSPAHAAPEFQPQPPMDNRRPARRMPEVGDFPEFAQQAYRAKRGDVPARRDPAVPAPPERKRSGLFTFLTGRKDATAATSESVRPDSQDRGRTRGKPEPEMKAQRDRPADWAEENSAVAPRRIPMPRHRPRQS